MKFSRDSERCRRLCVRFFSVDQYHRIQSVCGKTVPAQQTLSCIRLQGSETDRFFRVPRNNEKDGLIAQVTDAVKEKNSMLDIGLPGVMHG